MYLYILMYLVELLLMTWEAGEAWMDMLQDRFHVAAVSVQERTAISSSFE